MPLKLLDPTGQDLRADARQVVENNRKIEKRFSTGTFSVFNVVVDFGAKGNGVADDTGSIQSAINAAIAAGGGTVYLPAGKYLITATLDFSALKNHNFGINFQGEGRGDIFGTDEAATYILNNSGTTGIKAYGLLSGATQEEIVNLRLQDFMIQNVADIGASTWTIDLDYVIAGLYVSNVYISLLSFTGNGFRYRNFAHGQGMIEQVTVRGSAGDTGRTGFYFAPEVTSSVDTAPNSGNLAISHCGAIDVKFGWLFAGTNMMNGLTLISPKAVHTSATTGSIGYEFRSQFKQCSVLSPHAENYETGFFLNACEFNTFDSIIATHPDALIDADTAGVRVGGTSATNNWITGHVQKLDYGVSFEDNARTNFAMVRDRVAGRVTTALYRDISTHGNNIRFTGENDLFDLTWAASTHTIEGITAASVISKWRILADTNFRLRIYADGKHEWNEDGSGNIRTTLAMLPTSWFLGATPGVAPKITAITYSASMTPNCRLGVVQTITATNGTAFTINAPSNPPDAGFGGELEIDLLNSSGGALGAVTWNGTYKFEGGVAPTSPANGKKRLVRFRYDGTQWLEVRRSGADLL